MKGAGRVAGQGRAGLLYLVLLLSLTACQQTPRDPGQAFWNGDFQTAMAMWRVRAEAGDTAAQTWLGNLYYLGWGVQRDYGKALQWYRRAALRGNPYAQRNLGMMHEYALGVPENRMLAFGWYHEAKKGGNHMARRYLQSLGERITPNASLKGRALVTAALRHARGGVPGQSQQTN